MPSRNSGCDSDQTGNLMRQGNLTPFLGRLKNGENDLEGGLPPAAIGEDLSAPGDGFVERQKRARPIQIGRTKQLLTSSLVVDVKPVRRLAHIPLFAAHQGQAEERLLALSLPLSLLTSKGHEIAHGRLHGALRRIRLVSLAAFIPAFADVPRQFRDIEKAVAVEYQRGRRSVLELKKGGEVSFGIEMWIPSPGSG